MKGTGSCDSSHDFEARQAQRQVELVVGSVAHSFDAD